MKTFRRCLLFPAIMVVLAGMAPGPVSAQTNAYDDAYHYIYASATWYTNIGPGSGGLNYGFGFKPWVMATNGPNSHGFFTTHNVGTAPAPAIASPTNCCDAPGNNNSQHVWGLFANGGSVNGANWSVAYRGFSNSLDTTVVFKLQFQTDGIGGTANSAGFVLRNGNATNGVSDYRTAQRFSFYYISGGSNSFAIWDGNSVNNIGVPFTSGGLNCEFTLEAGDTYRFVIRNASSGAIIYIADSQPLTGSGTIDSVALFCNQTSNNQEFNRMQISSTSLVPPTIVNVQPTNGSVYIDPSANNVSFEVDSLASTLTGTNITLLLNGIAQSNLVFNTTGPTNMLMGTNTIHLGTNLLYTATIIAVDANSNTATNTSTFNTFSPLNLCIDAEDYNFTNGQFFPNPSPNAYAGLFGNNGVDYLEVDLSLTNTSGVYRVGDLPQILTVTGDPFDHAGFAAASATDYEIGWTETGEWQNYTRNLNNTNYTIYARAASGGGNGTILIDHLADSTATSSNQPLASLGTCIIPNTGGSKTYSGQMVPLTDFFSNPVQIRFAGTNTFRCTALNNKNYNLNYLMFVPNTNTATLKPYLSAGYPYPGATAVALESAISFTIANRQTAVNTATVQLLVDSNNVTGSITLSNNAAGTVVTYTPPSFLAPNSNHIVQAIFIDNGGVPATTTNTWKFTTINTTIVALPLTNALPLGSFSTPGFGIRIYKVEDGAPTTASIANAEAELAGVRTNANTSQPYPNLANGGPNADGSFSETGVLNYDIDAVNNGGTFGGDTAFPYVLANPVNNNIAMEALMYLQLTNGNYIFVVRSDDGFKLTTGPTPADTNFVIGLFDGGRGNGTPSTMYCTVATNGLFPMRLLYFQAGSGGNLEFYSINNGTPILINDLSNPNAIKSFQAFVAASPVTILNPAHSGGVTTFSFLSQSGHTHFVEYKNALTDGSWTSLTNITGNGSITNVTDNSASNSTRFYRVRSQ